MTADPVSQDAAVLRKLSDYYDIPVVAVHAPNSDHPAGLEP